MENIEGLAELQGQFTRLGALTFKTSALTGAQKIAELSARNAPVQTGNLRDSHTAVQLEDGAEVRVTAPYAGYVEFGTSRMDARPFLRPAIDQGEREVVAAAGKPVEEEISRAVGASL